MGVSGGKQFRNKEENLRLLKVFAMSLNLRKDDPFKKEKKKKNWELSQSRAAVWTALGIILVLDIFNTISFTSGWILSLVVLDIFIGINLLQERKWARTWMLTRIALGFLVFVGISFVQQDWSRIIIEVGFSGSLILILTGTSKRIRWAGSIVLLFLFSVVGIGWDYTSYLYLNYRGNTLYQQGRYSEAINFLEEELTVAERIFGRDDPDVALSLNNLAVLYDDLGDYAKAEPLYQRSLEIREKALGSDHPGVAESLSNLAALYFTIGDYSKAEPLYQRSLEIREKTLGSDHPDVATSLDNLAVLYDDLGDYAKAEPLYQRALEIREMVLGPDHLGVAASLNYLALLYRNMGDYAKAEPLHQRSLEIREKTLGSDHPGVAISLDNLTGLYFTIGDYAKAEPLYQRSLEIREKALGSDHPDVATSLDNLAVLYFTIGEYTKAEPLYQRSLEIREKALGSDHPDVAISLNNLALLYFTIGDYAKAEPLYQRSLEIFEKTLGSDHPSIAISLNNLARLYFTIGDYAKAEPLYQRSLEIREKALGSDHPDVATSLDNLAALYRKMGDYAKAESLHQRSLEIFEKTLGSDHPSIAISLNNLGVLYRNMGDYAKAEPLYQRSLEIKEKALGSDHPSIAISLNNLGVLYRNMEDYAKAEPLHQRSLEIREKALGSDHPDVAISLNNLALLYFTIGDYAKAEPLYQRSLEIFEKTLGSEHSNVARSLYNLAFLNASRQKYSSALEYFKEGLSIEERQIQNIFIIATEEQKLKFIQSISVSYESCLSLIRQQFIAEQDAVRYGLELVLRRKGIVLDAQSRSRGVLQGRLSESAGKDWNQHSSLRSDLSRLLLNKPEKMGYEDYRETIVSLQRQIEEIEKRLARESTLLAKELEQRKVTVKGVSKALAKNSALVEFVRIRDNDFAGGKWFPSGRYLAFVLSPDGEVELVDLGEARELEDYLVRVLSDIRKSIESPNVKSIRQSYGSLESFYTKVWAPLENSLEGVDKVLVSPDGLLNLVPFAALMDSNSRPLIERYSIAYVTSGRELIGADGELISPESELLLVANPAYDNEVFNSPIQVASTRSREFRGVFNPLPGTALEAKEIPPLVTGGEDRKRVLEGLNATEGAVKAARSPRILHLATHGFFLEDLEIPLDEGRGGPSSTVLYENPLVRSGLAFAGANHASEIAVGDDGILTALEISGMDLYGTDLVVLSACETGVGEVQTGEGVFGLRRAFALSGAKNLLMSLWPVSDKATVKQMVLFYTNLREMPPAEALRHAQLDTIKELEDELGIAPPMLWAPFILQGAQAFGKRE